MSDLNDALATVMANNPQMGMILYQREKLKRISSLVDLTNPSFKGIRALLETGLITPQQGLQMTLQLKNYQNNIAAKAYDIIYKNNLLKFQQNQDTREWMKSNEYIQTNKQQRAASQAQHTGIEQDVLLKSIDAGRKSVDTYYKTYSDNINIQYGNIENQIKADLQAKGIEAKDIFNKIEQKKDVGEKIVSAKEILVKDWFTKDEATRYYTKLSALAHMQTLLNRAKLLSYKHMDGAIKTKGAEAIFQTPQIVSLGMVEAMRAVHDANFYLNLNTNTTDPKAKVISDDAYREVLNLSHSIFGREIGDAVAVQMEADKQLYGENIVHAAPEVTEITLKALDELQQEEDKIPGINSDMETSSSLEDDHGLGHFKLDNFGKYAGGAAAVGVTVHYLKKFMNKTGTGDTEFDKQVKNEAAKVEGVDLNKIEKTASEASPLDKRLEEVRSKIAQNRKGISVIRRAREVGGVKPVSEPTETSGISLLGNRLNALGGLGMGLGTYLQLKDYMNFIKRAKNKKLTENEMINLGLMQ